MVYPGRTWTGQAVLGEMVSRSETWCKAKLVVLLLRAMTLGAIPHSCGASCERQGASPFFFFLFLSRVSGTLQFSSSAGTLLLCPEADLLFLRFLGIISGYESMTLGAKRCSSTSTHPGLVHPRLSSFHKDARFFQGSGSATSLDQVPPQRQVVTCGTARRECVRAKAGAERLFGEIPQR
jgi:hypothetical protein